KRTEKPLRLLLGMTTIVMLFTSSIGLSQAHGGSMTAVTLNDVWKYTQVAHGAEPGFEAVNYDDSTWATGQAGFGSSSGPCSWNNPNAVKTAWTINTDILLRKHITLPPGAHNLRVSGTIDNDAVVYINGTVIGSASSVLCAVGAINFVASDSLLNVGDNVIAIRGTDLGGVSYVDVTVMYDVAPTCQPGTFSASGSEPCEMAPAGSFVADAGATAATLCPAGTYQDQLGQTSCVLAQPGSYVDTTGAVAAIPCAPGYFQPFEAQSSCNPAPAGSFVATSGATAATQCSPGTFSATSGAIACTEAPAGSYVAGAGATEATLCAAGTFQDQPGQTNCTSSSAGSFVSGIGAIAAALCPAGTYQDQMGQTSCTPALAGSYVPDAGATSATPCTPGTFSAVVGASSCTPAPTGSYVDGSGAVAATPCVAGSFSATSGATACTEAPAGSYVAGSGATEATLCAVGTFQDQTGQTSCTQASAGSFVATSGATAATLCAPGTYQDQIGQASCIPAPPGSYVPTSGATAATLCPAGTTSAAGATSCQPIPVLYDISGFYRPVDMNGVVNTVKGGSTVPLKFEVFNGSVELTDTAIVTMSAKQITCATGAPTDAIEEIVATGGTGLRYDTTSGQFIYNWKTPKKAGTCYAVTATTSDGSSITAFFKLK
ncbi:MAG TPA: PxKF domain-containing protein, partial [Thermomicrobiales bacterium]|nr:PxKF domain-containing protein [Thermomicrobiales bacterium]